MLKRLSDLAADYYYRNEDLQYQTKEIYQYAFFVILGNLYFFLLCIVAGIIFGIIREMMIFSVSFALIRQFAGGFHANKEWKCDIISALIVLSNAVVLKYGQILLKDHVILTIFFCCSVLIAILSPVDSLEKPLTQKEKRSFKRTSSIFVLIAFSIVTLSYVIKHIIILPCCMGLITEALLLILGKISQKT